MEGQGEGIQSVTPSALSVPFLVPELARLIRGRSMERRNEQTRCGRQ